MNVFPGYDLATGNDSHADIQYNTMIVSAILLLYDCSLNRN